MSILVIHLLEWKDFPPLCFFYHSDSTSTKLLNLSLTQVIHPGQTTFGSENFLFSMYLPFAFIL